MPRVIQTNRSDAFTCAEVKCLHRCAWFVTSSGNSLYHPAPRVPTKECIIMGRAAAQFTSPVKASIYSADDCFEGSGKTGEISNDALGINAIFSVPLIARKTMQHSIISTNINHWNAGFIGFGKCQISRKNVVAWEANVPNVELNISWRDRRARKWFSGGVAFFAAITTRIKIKTIFSDRSCIKQRLLCGTKFGGAVSRSNDTPALVVSFVDKDQTTCNCSKVRPACLQWSLYRWWVKIQS